MAEVIFKKIDKEEDLPKTKKEKKKTAKKIKKVRITQCVGAFIFCLFMCLIAVIPYTAGDNGLTFTFEYLPFIGNGEILSTSPDVLLGASSLLGLEQSILDIISYGLDYFIVAFIAIVLFDILACIILFIFRFKTLRIIFKTISIICGIAMLLIGLFSIFYIVSLGNFYVSSGLLIAEIIELIKTSGAFPVLGTLIFSFIMAIKQFRWFAKPE